MVENGQNKFKVMSPPNKEKSLPGIDKPLVKYECQHISFDMLKNLQRILEIKINFRIAKMLRYKRPIWI